MFRTVSVVAALVVGLCVASAHAQTPFGGDDTGFLPPAADAKCEAGAAKAEGKLIACILKCHASRASGKLADDTAEDSCEKTLVGKSCAAKFTLEISKLKGCPTCINGTTMANLAGTIETLLDGTNSTIYCGGAPTCTQTTFNFSVNSSGGGPFTDSSWDDGSMTQPSAGAACSVTVKAPSGDITLMGTMGDAWTLSGFTGFAVCVLTGGCNANGGTCTACNGVDAPTSCPPLGIPNCTDNRPSCSTGLNGNASDTAHVTCSPTTSTTTTTTTTTTIPTCARLATLDCTNPTCPWCGQAFCNSQPPTSTSSCTDTQGLCQGSIIPGNCTSADCASQCLDCDNGLKPCQ